MSTKFTKTTTKLFTLLLIAVLVVVAMPVSQSFAASTGPNYPATGANVTDIGTIAWTGYSNIVSNDTQYATAPITKNGITNYLMGTNFNFGIPENAAINGIQVTIGRFSSLNGNIMIRDNVVSLVKAGTLAGDNKATATDWPTSEGTVTYGSATDLWGTTWTPADINNLNFGVALSATTGSNGNNNKTANVNYFTITVTYTTLTTSALTDTYGNTVTLSATLTPAFSDKLISFTLNGAEACSGTTLSTGVATCTATLKTNVGNYPNGVGASFAGDSSFGPLSSTASLDVSVRPITVTAGNDTKEYDGTTLSTGTPRITSGTLAEGDTADWTQAFEDKNVGTGKALIPAGTVSDGNGGLNYAVTFLNDTTGEIIALPISVTAAAESKVYDGTTSSAGVPSITSGALVADDSAIWTQTFDNKNAGVGKALIPTGTVSDGNGGLNYAVTFVNDTTGVIMAREIAVRAVTDSKVYDGTTSSVSVPTIVTGTLATGDTATWTQTFNNKNVGTGKTLTPAGSVSDGNGGLNYDVEFVSISSGVITARPITVTAVADSKVYNGTTSSAGVPSITSGTLAAGETATWTQTFNNKNIGTGKTLTPAGSVSDGNGGYNYHVTFVNNPDGEITVRPITVMAGTDTKVYDGTTNSAGVPAISSGSLAAGDSAVWTQTFADINVGTGKVMIPDGIVIDGNGGSNYAVTFANNPTGVITARPITVTAATDTKEYDGTTTSIGIPTITTGSLVAGDSALWMQTFEDKNVGTGKTLIPEGIVFDGNNGSNYAVNFANNSTGVIKALKITVTAVTDSKVYDGTTSSAGVPSITSGVLAVGDSSVWTQTFDSQDVGTAKTLTPAGTVDDGNNGLNYAVTFVNDHTGVITARPITVAADLQTKVYGNLDPALTYQVTSGSLATGDAFTGALSRDPGENVGTYAITQGTLLLTTNYTLTYVGSNFTITRADQTITVTTHAPATALNGSSFTVAATSSSGLEVSFSASGACTNVGATFTMTSGTGSCSVQYDQAGNSNYNAAPQIVETVNGANAPVVTQDPVNAIVLKGGNATFTADASGDPTPTVIWQVSIDGGAVFTDMPGETSRTLTIVTPPPASNGYQYRAIFTNTGGSATTKAATLVLLYQSSYLPFISK